MRAFTKVRNGPGAGSCLWHAPPFFCRYLFTVWKEEPTGRMHQCSYKRRQTSGTDWVGTSRKRRQKRKWERKAIKALLIWLLEMAGDCWLILSPRAGLNGEMLSRSRGGRSRQPAEGCGRARALLLKQLWAWFSLWRLSEEPLGLSHSQRPGVDTNPRMLKQANYWIGTKQKQHWLIGAKNETFCLFKFSKRVIDISEFRPLSLCNMETKRLQCHCVLIPSFVIKLNTLHNLRWPLSRAERTDVTWPLLRKAINKSSRRANVLPRHQIVILLSVSWSMGDGLFGL